MSQVIFVLNAGSVGVFGTLLSVSFCDIPWNRKNKCVLFAAIILLGTIQACLYSFFGSAALREWYPVITHLPLMLLLGLYYHQGQWSISSVLIAYLCCQFRRWIALLVVGICSGTVTMQDIIEFSVTIPLLFLIVRFISPSLRTISKAPMMVQIQFALIPAINYGFDYLTRIYTDWLIRGVPAAVEFMPFVCSSAYLAFALYMTENARRQSEMEQLQSNLNLQVKQSVNEIEALRNSHEQAAAYRHDMRHHLQFLSSCIENGTLEQAQAYIYDLNHKLDNQIVKQYCENTTINLILSSFAEQANKKRIPMKLQVSLGKNLLVSDNDLCVLLSNALENALHACEKLKPSKQPVEIHINAYEKGNQIFLQIINSCEPDIEFRGGLPVTKQTGHGIGVRSICAIVEKYNGLCSFSAENQQFILRLSLQNVDTGHFKDVSRTSPL